MKTSRSVHGLAIPLAMCVACATAGERCRKLLHPGADRHTKYIVDTLNAEFVKAMADKEVRERLTIAGVEPTSSTADSAAALLKDEVDR